MILFLLLACVDDTEVIEPYRMGDCVVPETTGDTTAWLAWAEEQRVEFEATGTCPTEAPAEAVLADGCPYATDAFVFPTDATIQLGLRYGMEGAFLSTELKLKSASWRQDRDCESSPEFSNVPGEGEFEVRIEWMELGQQSPPMFMSSLEDYYSSSGLAFIGTSQEGDYRLSRDSSVMGWVCLEELSPLTEADDGPTDAQGSAFFHVEGWVASTLPPIDLFLPIDHDDCADAENAYPVWGDESGYTYPEDCDGLDNDFDGEIDDFGDDWDGDGVVDCR